MEVKLYIDTIDSVNEATMVRFAPCVCLSIFAPVSVTVGQQDCGCVCVVLGGGTLDSGMVLLGGAFVLMVLAGLCVRERAGNAHACVCTRVCLPVCLSVSVSVSVLGHPTQ